MPTPDAASDTGDVFVWDTTLRPVWTKSMPSTTTWWICSTRSTARCSTAAR